MSCLVSLLIFVIGIVLCIYLLFEMPVIAILILLASLIIAMEVLVKLDKMAEEKVINRAKEKMKNATPEEAEWHELMISQNYESAIAINQEIRRLYL